MYTVPYRTLSTLGKYPRHNNNNNNNSYFVCITEWSDKQPFSALKSAQS